MPESVSALFVPESPMRVCLDRWIFLANGVLRYCHSESESRFAAEISLLGLQEGP